MKYLVITILFLCIAVSHAFAVSPTPTDQSKPTEEAKVNSLNEQINNLKDKIASRVAQLNLVDKRGITGTVTEVKDTQVTLLDPQQKKRIIDIDEITKFSSPSAKSSFGISDIEKGNVISIIGLYNKQTRRVLARFVEASVSPIFITGVISDTDADDFTISVLDNQGTITIVDIEKLTKTNTYTEEDDIVKSGFSKLSPGNRVVISGYADDKEKNRLTGIRILQLPEAPKNPGITFTTPESETTPKITKKPTP